MSEKPIEIPGLGSITASAPEAAWLGPLLGLAVGDALGTTYEFSRMEQPGYPTLATGPATDIVGEGPFGLEAGQVTDDTQMAICIARSLVERHAADPARAEFDRLDRLDLATRYVAWYQHAFDVGNQTASALRTIESGTDVATAGHEVWHASGRRAAGNGSLMRTAPIGVMLAYTATRFERPEQLVEAALTDSMITHADPRCALACAAFDLAIAHGVALRSAGSSTAPTDIAGTMLEAARRALSIGAARLRELWSDDRDDLAALASAEADLARDLDAARADDPKLYGPELDLQQTAGFVRVAFRIAFWHLGHTPSWRDAVVDVSSRGGDADTNAAIVGALLGARDGLHAIPAAWIERVLGVAQPGPMDWANAHHPRHLLAIATHLRAATAAGRGAR
jgi:ADP-ribosylglycohydrolase